MDGELSQPTQPATQNVLDPRRLGKQNSGFTDEDIADIICLLIPYSPNARSEAARLARECSPFVLGREEAQYVDVDYTYEDYAGNFALSTADPGSGPAFVLRLSALVKNPLQGFTFGRNPNRCDICFNNDTLRRLSNIHFRIFINEHGVLMLQDQSTNGTAVDEVLLRARRPGSSNMRTLTSGTKISILLQNNAHDLAFLVRVPRREGQYEAAYRQNLNAYLERIAALADGDAGAAQQTIAAGPAGIVNLFPQQPQAANGAAAPRRPPLPRFDTAQADGLPREWNGSNSYNRVGQIGKGAFATVHKVTSKFDGKPYAAKELDKRRFVKNGVLDQKVENEMKIMQNIQHPNIVRYIEHFDFDDRLFIIIMEFVSGGDLGSYITNRGCLPEATVKEMAGQLIDALGYLHRKNITHRDVKPDNILIESLTPFTVKLTDFGLSKMVDNEQTFLRTFCGTLLYCAPEVYAEYNEYDENGHRSRNRKRGRIPGQRYDHAIDIWSLGGVLFYCLTGSPPFPVTQGTSYTELLHWIMTRPLNVQPLIDANVSSDCVHFLSQMLQSRPEKRATVEALQRHPWLAGPEAASAEALEQSASQLSLADQELPSDPHSEDFQSDDEILDDDLVGSESQLGGLVTNFELVDSQKENYEDTDVSQQPATVRGPPQQRLFGEVNMSAVGSSGVIPEDRLNLPLSDLGSFSDPSKSYSSGSQSSSESESGKTFRTPRGEHVRQQQQQLGQQWSQPRSQPRPGHHGGNGHGIGNGQVPAPLSQSNNFQESHSVDELNNLTFDVASQSLGGAESILGNLNMKSVATSNFKQSFTDLNSSKRKPAHDTSDEFDSGAPADKPTIKRLKSETHMESASDPTLRDKKLTTIEGHGGIGLDDDHDIDEEEAELYAAVKPINHSRTGRQMDLPVHKSVYWTPGEPSSWHLQYPEMTQLQYDVFEDAAMARREEFRPGYSLLWNLAMRHFPPTTVAARSRSGSHISDTVAAVGGISDNNDATINSDQKENIEPDTMRVPPAARESTPSSSPFQQTAPPSRGLSSTPQPQQQQPAQLSQFSQQLPQAEIVVPVVAAKQQLEALVPTPAADVEAARLDSVPDSIVQNISIPITESITTWGRGPDNTLVYTPRTELKVPKYAFKILLFRNDGEHGSEPWKDLHPWDRLDARGEVARHYHFYISTKARGGLLVNGTPINSVDPGNAHSASRFWTRLYDGDSVVAWHNLGATGVKPQRTELVFRCTWGGSAVSRSASTASVDLVDEPTSRRLDEACLRAERFVEQRAKQRRWIAEANRDVAERNTRIEQERQRSVAFEQRRADVLSRWQQNNNNNNYSHSQRPKLAPSPVSAPPVLITVGDGDGGNNASNGGSNSSSLTPTPSLTPASLQTPKARFGRR